MTLAGHSAQLTATLQSGDKMTPFYGADAFKDALAAAVDGDIITLSPGTFNAANITKSVTVIGASAFSDDYTYFSVGISVNADNVSLEGIRFVSLSIYATDNLRIDRCWFTAVIYDGVNGDKKYHTNTIIKDSEINLFSAMEYSKNLVLRNCYISYFSDENESINPSLIENCNVQIFACYTSCLNTSYNQPYAIYRNCRLGFYTKISKTDAPDISFNSPSEFHNNQFVFNYDVVNGSYTSKTKWFVRYGSCINEGTVNIYNNIDYMENNLINLTPSSFEADGIYGPQNLKSEPAIPNITSSEIDTETNADGNLHVKITAEARD